MAGGLAVIVAGGLGFFWKNSGDKVENEIVAQIVSESNRDQDRALALFAQDLRMRGFRHYAVVASNFLHGKQKIEGQLHDLQEITPPKMEIESLVDRICLGVPDQFERLIEVEARLDGKKGQIPEGTRQELTEIRSQIVERITRAQETLSDTYNGIGTLVDPTGGTHGHLGEGAYLDDAITRLREEAEIARRVRERVMGEETGGIVLDEPSSGGDSEVRPTQFETE